MLFEVAILGKEDGGGKEEILLPPKCVLAESEEAAKANAVFHLGKAYGERKSPGQIAVLVRPFV